MTKLDSASGAKRIIRSIGASGEMSVPRVIAAKGDFWDRIGNGEINETKVHYE